MKKMGPILFMIGLLAVLLGCADRSTPTVSRPFDKPVKSYEDLVVGFAQVGAESIWRSANTADIKKWAEDLQVELKFADAQQKHDNQILAVRKFIIEKVDVIGISPVVETGWTEVFQEAKAAGIPIILLDRQADVPEDLYVTYLGSDFEEEGRKAARKMIELTGGKANIVELQGNKDSAPTTGRYAGFREILQGYPDMAIIDTQFGDFTKARGKEVMDEFLKTYGTTITALFAHNDDMALGAIEAIEAFGLRPGVDIKIVSVDASKDALQAIVDGKLNVSVECNPLLGKQFFELALKVVNGEPVAKRIPSIETIFDINNAAEFINQRGY